MPIVLEITNVFLTSNPPADSVGDRDAILLDDEGVALNPLGFKDIILGVIVGRGDASVGA